MRSFPLAMVSMAVVALTLSCTGGRGADGENGQDGKNGTTCTVSQTATGAVVTCDDGTSATIANGATGSPGKNGADGEDGATGNDGLAGIDGLNGQNALVALADEPAGTNCVYGGTKVTAGNDVNGNKVLDSTELTTTRYVCNGQPGTNGTIGTNGTNGRSSLVNTSDEPAGTNCLEGGIRVDVGLDDDGSGTLSTLEIDRTSYLCQPQCVLENAKTTIPASASGSLDYASNTTFDANYLLASTGASSDVVGWMGFSLAGLTTGHAVLGMRLYVRNRPETGSPSADPTLRVVHGPATTFTRTGLSTTNMPRGKFVSDLVSGVAPDAWTEIRLDIDSTTLAADRVASQLSLGLDEVTTPTQTIHFYGADDPATRPYMEVETLRCANP